MPTKTVETLHRTVRTPPEKTLTQRPRATPQAPREMLADTTATDSVWGK